LHLFQIDDSEDDDVIKRQRVGEGHIIADHGSDSQLVQDDIIAVYVLYTSGGELSVAARLQVGQ
jgi:hypothetical protein